MSSREMQISSREAVVMRGGDFAVDAIGVSHIISGWGVVETTRCTCDMIPMAVVLLLYSSGGLGWLWVDEDDWTGKKFQDKNKNF
jgi:hypothetical protein